MKVAILLTAGADVSRRWTGELAEAPAALVLPRRTGERRRGAAVIVRTALDVWLRAKGSVVVIAADWKLSVARAPNQVITEQRPTSATQVARRRRAPKPRR